MGQVSHIHASEARSRYAGWVRLGVTLLSLGLGPAVAAESEVIPRGTSGADAALLFDSDEVLEVRLYGPIEKLLEDTSKRQRRFEISAENVQQPVGVKTGGRSRLRVCDFPPLRLDFTAITDSPSPHPDSIFRGNEFLYVTTQCNFNTRSRADLIEEYLAYRILNLITEFSYRVRLIKVNYIDSRRDGKSITHYAFLTESQYVLARRMGAEVLEVEHILKRLLNEDHAALIYVFQYLIANTDWSLVTAKGDEACCHNGQLIDRDSQIFYVPFDFDLSGLVNPRYAYPDSSLPIQRVTQRLYRGYCGPEDALSRALEHVLAQREAIIELYSQALVLSRDERDSGIDFLERFFAEAGDPERLLTKFQRKCLD